MMSAMIAMAVLAAPPVAPPAAQPVTDGEARRAEAARVGELIEHLRSNDTRWDAIRAMHAIHGVSPAPLAALEAALNSEDFQQRQLAAALLRDALFPAGRWGWFDRDGEAPSTEPDQRVSRRLLEVTIEGLRDDTIPWDGTRNVMVANASGGFRFLVRYASQAVDLLEAGCRSSDEQQRLICALALGFGRVSSAAELVAETLLPHLRDNDILGDALWAVRALYLTGRQVIPYLMQALPEADDQQRSLIELLIRDFDDPPRDKGELVARRGLQRVTSVVYDPALESPHTGLPRKMTARGER